MWFCWLQNNLLLLATCYFRRNQAHRAYHVLKGMSHFLLLKSSSIQNDLARVACCLCICFGLQYVSTKSAFSKVQMIKLRTILLFCNSLIGVVFVYFVGAKSTQCRYLFALACFEMDSMGEAEAALLSCVESGSEVCLHSHSYSVFFQLLASISLAPYDSLWQSHLMMQHAHEFAMITAKRKIGVKQCWTQCSSRAVVFEEYDLMIMWLMCMHCICLVWGQAVNGAACQYMLGVICR